MSRNALSALTRRTAHGCVLAMVLAMAMAMAGCGVVGRTSVKTVQLALQGTPDVTPVAAEVMANRYPQIKVSGPQGGAVLVLGNIDDGVQAWYSSERSIVFLRDGIVVATHGGSPEMRGMAIAGENPLRDLRNVRDGTTVQRRYDVMPGYRYGMQVTGTLQVMGSEHVTILGTARPLTHVRERLRGPGWKRDNHYWVDPSSGFIWKSVQAIAPDTSLEIVQLKPYAPDLQRR